MKKTAIILALSLGSVWILHGQSNQPTAGQRKAITSLIDQYSEAREKSDTVLLKTILMTDIDQLVSNGEWRDGINAAVQGMVRSSSNTPGTRTLTVEKIKMLNQIAAIVDCRYEIQSPNNPVRKMWSSFIVVADNQKWKISAIRNMLPSNQ